MWTLGISVGSTGTTQWGWCARARAKPHLGETNCMNLVRPISAKIKIESCSSKLGGIDCTFWWDRNNYTKQQRVCKAISVRPRSVSMWPNCYGFWLWLCHMNSVAPDRKNQWGRVEVWFWTYLDGESGWGFWSNITKHLSNWTIKQHLIPF